MKVKTHVKLAELSLIKNSTDIPKGFSMFMFNFGLVMVDQSWLIKTHPHYMQKSLKYINQKIANLLSLKIFDAYASMQLGVVVHYLCDFCCHSHISGSVGNISYHLKYERELQRYLLQNFDVLKNQIHNKANSPSLIPNDFPSIKTSINNTLTNYTKGQASYAWDVANCIEISSLVCSAVFNFSFSNNTAPNEKLLKLPNLSIYQ